MGGSDGDEAGPDELASAKASKESGDVAPTGGVEVEAGALAGAAAAGATAPLGATVEVVGVSDDTGDAPSDADETGPAMTVKPTATSIARGVATLRFRRALHSPCRGLPPTTLTWLRVERR